MNNDPEPTIQQLFDLREKTALVTGAAGYLGGAFSRALAEAGARVVASSRQLSRAQSVADALPTPNSQKHLAVELDQMDEASLEAGFRQTVEQTQYIDILVNNGHEGLGHDWSDVTGEQFTRQLANCTGYFLLARLLRDHTLRRQASGEAIASVIMLGSMYGVVGSYPQAYEGVCTASPAAYHALKGGIVHLTRHLAVYWAADGVRVNCLSPGPFPVPGAPEELLKRLQTRSPLGRMGRPHELKGALLFLASDASSYVTGQNLIVDGGWTAW